MEIGPKYIKALWTVCNKTESRYSKVKARTKKLLIILCVVLLLILFVAVLFIKKYGPRFGLYLFPPTAQEYVQEAVTFMDNGIYSDRDEWFVKKQEFIDQSKSCKTYEDTYAIIQEALKVAGGKHSAIISSETKSVMASNKALPEVSFEDGILYILLPPCDSTSGIHQDYVASVIDVIEGNESDIQGVILDLRDNTGGDMGPMVAAVSPLLPDGTLMWLRTRGNELPVTLEAGTVRGGGSESTASYTKKLNVPIAILQNELTASSGEATLICFKGLDNVKTFGSDSAGYCSSNYTKYMYDGACILLTTGKDVDRLGNEYCEDPIAPDVYSDEPVEAARAWIYQEGIL